MIGAGALGNPPPTDCWVAGRRKKAGMLERCNKRPFHVVPLQACHGFIGLVCIILLAGPQIAISQAVNAPSPNHPSASSPAFDRRAFEHPLNEIQGDIYLAKGQYAAAIDAYASLHSHSAIVWNKIGMAYHHLSAFDAARKAYLQALSINPRYAPAANNLAAVYYTERDFKHAEHYYKRALKYTSEDAVIYCNLGTAYFAEQNYNKGKKEYRKALALDQHVFAPDKATVVEAMATREQRIALNYYLAQTFAGLGKQEEALLYLRKAMNEGFNDRKRLTEDKEFAGLRTTPEFQQLMTQEWSGPVN